MITLERPDKQQAIITTKHGKLLFFLGDPVCVMLDECFYVSETIRCRSAYIAVKDFIRRNTLKKNLCWRALPHKSFVTKMSEILK